MVSHRDTRPRASGAPPGAHHARRPLVAVLLAASFAAPAGGLAGCGGSDGDTGPGAGSGTRTSQTADARRPPAAPVLAALAALPTGRYVTGELNSGVVRRRPGGAVLARLPVTTGGQRGLLGLAASVDGRTIWASYTSSRDGGRLVVDRLRPGPRRRVWTGPVGTPLATGGHLEHDPDTDTLVIGVGDLQDPPALRDPAAPNGKLLRLDPDGPPDQTPGTLSSGWNNPFAFARTPRGRLIVADNAPGRRPERIGPGAGRGPLTDLRGKIAPSGVAALGERTIAVCGVVSGRLDRFEQDPDTGRWRRTAVLDRDCRYGVLRLTDGRLVVAGARGTRVLDPPEGPA